MLCEAPHTNKTVPEATYHFGVSIITMTIFGKTYYIGDKVNLCAEHARILYDEAREELKYSWM